MLEQESYRRRSARVLLVDGRDRVLLLRSLMDLQDPESGYGWFTPGGGVDESESLAQAAARELHEEVGLTVEPYDLGEPVAYCTGHADLDWASGLLRDDFFFHRVSTHEVDTSGMETLERRHFLDHHWWSPDELASTSEVVYPFGLVELLAELLEGRVPERAVQLSWRH